MDFSDQLLEMAVKIPKQIDIIKTEEATKSAFVMPFINALGYNVFDPTEVIPEYTADVGIKKGEKVDYAIKRDGKIIMLFECKSCMTDLDNVHASQLYRYFSVSEARIGVLTNGIVYRFFSDLEEKNKMDDKPFLEFDMLKITEPIISELKKLTKLKFDEDELISTASELKYSREIKRILNEQLNSPNEEFVRFLGSMVYSGRMTQNAMDFFNNIVKSALNQFISDKINERLKSAMTNDTSNEVTEEEEEITEIEENKINTTEEEMEGFYVVKSIVRDTIDPSRVYHRDKISYFGILLDDNNRKPICRLYFNGSQKKYLALIKEDKKEEKVEIHELNDIYKYADEIKKTLELYN